MKFKYASFVSFVSFIIGIAGCSKSTSSAIKDEQTTIVYDSLMNITSRLYRNQLTGVYYFKFRHIPVGSTPENRFVAILSMAGDSITDINEKAFKQIFNFYVDGNYMFRIVDHYDLYEIHTMSIDSVPKGCYFENSNYRVLDDRVEYYHGRGVTECNSSPNQIIEIPLPKSAEFQVLDVEGLDYSVLDGKILVNGCWLTDSLGQNSSLYNDIIGAVREKKFKPKYCYSVRPTKLHKKGFELSN